jgi:hypothetical protein
MKMATLKRSPNVRFGSKAAIRSTIKIASDQKQAK